MREGVFRAGLRRSPGPPVAPDGHGRGASLARQGPAIDAPGGEPGSGLPPVETKIKFS